ncbi:50S ribosomal protein L21 [Candidatus Desantisbacteria bacterium CG2_30_40_21]|uniref:Large ribosomal subunit protein bL21 n=5 Tax=unclassified Candidatus Desantisiibacteriota TaxID=3106372 RepID=A0A2M7JC91_9BACT|nr:MAG: 50S ribosomal protein L21 [Candidatus Desantisbacteria bacterium CG2_30_40_21]PIP40013.1 MAG: 50S ribosomal protein L21 [Candidatus Desantisbacteria bacterium CG23_combo_of_CG06-09_8_20_14_all_40_23]PIX17004.1 MAG: 50S ribosomal protein L21 [Candidatus Desantisbacteria bacterium CG_4_8_14_3_um_filter_40_12]PIY18930.1 MAG: 50S ribosomal protein L21 [Candidatus Desantisbacteria bacterium CG_4_10_14_3_um_filter_40_18]PJB29659.1 MAG: 50S ribosomal protein L21 [Candidatus Desantisbacteria ba
MYAIVETGGKQYQVEKGSRINVEKISSLIGDMVVLDHVIMVNNGDSVLVGENVKNAKIMCNVMEQGKEKKITITKFKRRKNYRKKTGHRQRYTGLLVTELQA